MANLRKFKHTDGRVFHHVGTKPHTTLDGRDIVLQKWETCCSLVGCESRVTTATATTNPAGWTGFKPPKYCREHADEVRSANRENFARARAEGYKRWKESPEGKALMAQRANSPELKAARVAGLKRWLESPEGKAAMERRKSPEAKAARAEGLRRWMESPEGKAAMSQKKQRSQSPEAKAARAEGYKRWKESPEGKAALERKKHQWNSPEAKAARAEGHKRWLESQEKTAGGRGAVITAVYDLVADRALVEGAVSVEELKRTIVDRLPPPPAGKKDTRAYRVLRAARGLVGRGLLVLQGDVVSLPAATKPAAPAEELDDLVG